MTELDQFWSEMIQRAAIAANNSGRSDIVEYLRLKAANDAIRAEGVKWLTDSMIEIAGRAARNVAAVNIERREPYSFARGNSNMVGSQLSIRHGVRCLTLDAGWTRTPADGIIRGNSLAAARICHFGMHRNNIDLSLAYAGDLPLWHIENEDGKRRPLVIADLHHHFNIFLDR